MNIEHYTRNVAVSLHDINNKRLDTKGTVIVKFRVCSEKGREILFQSFIVAEGISEQCILGLDALNRHKFMFDGREQTIYRLRDSTEPHNFSPVMVVSTKPTIPPFSASVVESERAGGKLPKNVACFFVRAPELPAGLRIDPFVSSMREGGIFRIVVVNETDAAITLPRFQVLGEIELTQQTVSQIASVSEKRIPIKKENIEIIENALPTIDDEFREQLRTFLLDNHTLFAFSTSELGCTGIVKHRIDTEGKGPLRQRPYRASPMQREQAKEIIKELLDNDIIRPSLSPWASPIILVKKKNNENRLGVDYRKLNAITKKDSFPLPRIDDVLDMLHSQRIFSTLDLAAGYWQIEVEEDSKEKTAFIVDNNLSEWNKLAFGLCNAPGTFQRLMNTVLHEVIGKTCLVYLDDIIIFSKNKEEHLKHISQIFELLEKANLKMKLSKCKFFQSSVNYLGHVISDKGIEPDPEKIDKIANYKRPETIQELVSFLGLASYYRRFIDKFSTIAHPLLEQTKNKDKNEKIEWSEEDVQAFEILRTKLIAPPILSYPDFSEEFMLFADASNYGVGAVLSQIQNGKEVVIAYASRHLNET